jgi:hypothetical protein
VQGFPAIGAYLKAQGEKKKGKPYTESESFMVGNEMARREKQSTFATITTQGKTNARNAHTRRVKRSDRSSGLPEALPPIGAHTWLAVFSALARRCSKAVENDGTEVQSHMMCSLQ